MNTSLRRFSFGRIAFLLSSALALVLTGCIDKAVDEAPEPISYISFYHGSPDSPDFNVMVDNQTINSQAFRYANSSNYVSVRVGSHQVAFTPVTAADAVADTTFEFTKDKIYSVFTVGQLENINIMVLQDSLIVPASGSAGVRLINLSPDAPAVSLVISGAEATPIVSGLGFKQDSPFKNLVAGTYSFKVLEAGTDNVLMPATNLNVDAGGNYTLIVRGFKTPPAGNTNVLALQMIRNY